MALLKVRSKHPGRCPSLPLARSSLPSFPPSLPTLFISVIPHPPPPPPPPFTHEAYSKLLSSCAPHCRRTAEIKRAHRAGKKTSRSLWPPRSRFAFLLWLPEGLPEPHHLLAALSKKEKTFFPSPQEKGCGSPEKTAPFQPAHQKSPVSPAGRHRLYGTQVDLKIPGDLQTIRVSSAFRIRCFKWSSLMEGSQPVTTQQVSQTFRASFLRRHWIPGYRPSSPQKRQLQDSC
nr:PREDICTED: espin-like [Anolis carolinensis]|eukprot:XP_016851498.1 PREDICTED: espin-like [Anolis carolinensis]